ncbi:FHA domain-containing protein [Pseudoalteromonas tunicata]|jgi:pSer/pThr/pTyr-binding forkhead associated (FHA) protein|uniref:FHA domain containing protein n=1 Tax=Pseudoalteromonas tunicata D2 TaxID=87626 RepID=A4CCW6_9GAMM|nr:FHA domain-containing protein [Pseudoalteromonas tunicata]ATC93915.1 hypothetical protein PTUN_a1259 [Pseudoalteromonas tunicata]AXT29717.1 FHA domain-containing protein [Pseudoalteromonas tunicata]EAR27409.1 FHA domain containing protein [Pseudoalteromonas tunicata D2]MDP4984386.1 FHA domain-containing protein [Pseudoalteromonas tunicata]MDP5212932.1 FHA domain-containing protein [Pseudoalteromonas tunicata]
MANLQNQVTLQNVILLSQHIFGRHPSTSHTVIKDIRISRNHATIFWDGVEWLLQDASTNGCFINEIRLQPNTKHRLHLGDVIHFATLESEGWEVTDTSEPKDILVPINSGLNVIELDRLIVLPSEDAPEVTLYLSPNGHWVCETNSGISVLQSGDVINTQYQKWRYIEAKISDETAKVEAIDMPSSPQVGIYFDVSQNEEHVGLKFLVDNFEYDLGQRSHHYLLLVLARKRLEDKNAGVIESEQGWLDKDLVSKMIGQSEAHLNIQIHRFRKQLISMLPKSSCLPQAVERRTGEMRFAFESVEITGGALGSQYVTVKKHSQNY